MLANKDLPQSFFDSLGIDADYQIREINATPVNTTYCISAEGERFLIKQFHADHITGRARPALMAMQRKIARTGLAPMPLYLNQTQGIYAEDWVRHSIEPFTVLDDQLKMERLAKALALTHDLAISTVINDLPSQWAQYLTTIPYEEHKVLQEKIKQLHSSYEREFADTEHRVFCHNDLALNHIIDHTKPVIIDWEYAATGNRFFDIASSIKINQLNRQQIEYLTQHYAHFSGFSAADVKAGLARVHDLVELTYQLWYGAVKAFTKITEK
ncbi:phosphotransferase [Alteromonas flava]|uniref:phosphotransferase n=1 Tax=Alteromonas flava TaxID=2048003 RepID=UPI000C288EA2|nr:phosphotransferase [Alteromonas flava]